MKIEYIGAKDSRGLKQGFGIQKMRDGSRFRGIFTNDRVTGWGIYEHRDGDVYQGQYENDRTSGYGEYHMEMEQFITVIGMMICNLESDMKYGEILHNIPGNIIMGNRME